MRLDKDLIVENPAEAGDKQDNLRRTGLLIADTLRSNLFKAIDYRTYGAGIAVVAPQENLLLLVNQTYGNGALSFPGGGLTLQDQRLERHQGKRLPSRYVDLDRYYETAKRELLEETGLDADKDIQMSGKFTESYNPNGYNDSGSGRDLSVNFEAMVDDPYELIDKVKLSSEIRRIGFYPVSEVATLEPTSLHHGVREYLRSFTSSLAANS